MANDEIDITNEGTSATPKRGRNEIEDKTKVSKENKNDDMKSQEFKKAKDENEKEREERKKREEEEIKKREEEIKKREEEERKNYKMCHMALATTLKNLKDNT